MDIWAGTSTCAQPSKARVTPSTLHETQMTAPLFTWFAQVGYGAGFDDNDGPGEAHDRAHAGNGKAKK